MTAGDRVVATASKYLGIRESGGANRGPYIDGWASRWGLKGVAWCGIFADAMFAEADVDDDDLCHPAVAEMCRRARSIGAVWDGRSTIPPGALWAACGVHVGIITADLGGGIVSTIDGNSGNAVSMRTRSVDTALIIIPPAVLADVPPPAPPEPIRTYWVEDQRAEPKLYGPWATRASRDRAFASIPKIRQRRARLVRGRGGGYAWIEGPRRLYGPWSSQEARDRAQDVLERRLGRNLRPFSKSVTNL